VQRPNTFPTAEASERRNVSAALQFFAKELGSKITSVVLCCSRVYVLRMSKCDEYIKNTDFEHKQKASYPVLYYPV